ncbi:hypothetical protein GW587_02025 [Duganella sp. SAP-35]|uniref:DUF3999 family protein n=2 Tax=Duganella aceris TaxID=2703883 RepID=A0ABX0FES1_9BURK|nr:hypothetical protein [Duganella aceris]
MMSTDFASIAPPLASLATGVVSAALYGRKRKWINALLAGVAGVALALMVADLRLPAAGAGALAVDTGSAGQLSDADRLAIPRAAAIALTGDGLREAEWRDLPARPVQWKPAAADLLWLDFPRTMSLGRIFTLTVRRAPAQAGWRLQLLAENKQVLADSGAAATSAPGASETTAVATANAVAAATAIAVSGAAKATTATGAPVATAAPGRGVTTAAAGNVAPVPQLSVQWLPPVAENMVLQARLLDAAGKIVAQGPIPLQVKDALPLQIQGRFDAPSFDARALNQLLADGSAIVDWSVTLGKAIARSETARAPLTAPNAMFVDAAYVEHLSPSARAALLAQTGQGVPMVILGGNAADASLWQRELGLSLRQQSPTTEKEDVRQFSVAGVALSMPPATLNPADNVGAPWSVLARDGKKQPWLWQRDLRQGRVIWIGVSDWHRYAISAPQALTLWWQGAMDQIALASVQKAGWQLPDAMPLPGLRSELCAQGAKAGTTLQVEGAAELRLQSRADKADAICTALWPQKSGWMKFTSAGVAEPGLEYVYAAQDWPAWQRALRRDATAQYAARALPVSVGVGAGVNSESASEPASRPLPVAPFAVLFALCMLGLWWREQRQPAA